MLVLVVLLFALGSALQGLCEPESLNRSVDLGEEVCDNAWRVDMQLRLWNEQLTIVQRMLRAEKRALDNFSASTVVLYKLSDLREEAAALRFVLSLLWEMIHRQTRACCGVIGFVMDEAAKHETYDTYEIYDCTKTRMEVLTQATQELTRIL